MNFIKTFLAALLAIVVAHFMAGMFVLMMMAGVVLALGEKSEPLEKDSILRIDLASPLNDAPSVSPLQSLNLDMMRYDRTNTLYDAVTAIDYASSDDRISGIYINVENDATSLANLEELRAAIDRFRGSGKFVVSYNTIYSQAGYYLSSVADKVYMSPEGLFTWQGMSSPVLFFKGLLDKLGVEVEVFRHGSFKAAAEPFLLTGMSPENSLQINSVLGSVWGAVLDDIGRSRSIDTAELARYASQLVIRDGDDALACGLIDDIKYQDEVYKLLHDLSDGGRYDDYDDEAGDEAVAERSAEDLSDEMESMGSRPRHEPVALTPDQQPNFVSLGDYIRHTVGGGATDNSSSNKIAIVYADGEIVDGGSLGYHGYVGDQTFASKLARARMDDNVKAVVIRVNSPGGSAIASESMWRAVEVLRSVKPVVVSMGGEAASGGYYIACGADAIFANRTTITGSIGVFGLLINAGKGLEDKLGITVDVARTGPSADLDMPFRGVTDHERMYMQYGVDRVYENFVGHVAEGRNMAYEDVDAVAGGRVWSGVDADRVGLVDGFGGLRDAVEYAASRAGVEGDYGVTQLIDNPGRLAAIMGAFTEISSARMRSQMGDMFIHYSSLKAMLEQSGRVQARTPYTFEIR